jgi:uncharacterized RDD family membrane protein YckC
VFCEKCGTRASDTDDRCTLCGAPLPGRTPHAASVAALGVTAAAHPQLRAPRYGGFWRRLMAVLLDAILLYFPAATVRVLMGLPAINTFNTMDADSTAAMMASAIELLIDWLYAAAMIASSHRATLGMMVMDLQVCDVHGRRISFSRATWRYFAQFLSLITAGLGYLMQLFTPRRQTLHDMLSSTVVVRPEREPATAPLAEMRLVT